MGRGTDLLVHEAIGVEGAGLPDASLDHMLQSHVFVDELGPIAEEAEAEHLVVSHYADLGAEEVDTRRWRRDARKGYRGRVTIGEDLDRFRLPTRSRGRG